MPDCAMATTPEWPGKPRVCVHTEVIAAGGVCRDEVCWTLAVEDDARRLERARE